MRYSVTREKWDRLSYRRPGRQVSGHRLAGGGGELGGDSGEGDPGEGPAEGEVQGAEDLRQRPDGDARGEGVLRDRGRGGEAFGNGRREAGFQREGLRPGPQGRADYRRSGGGGDDRDAGGRRGDSVSDDGQVLLITPALPRCPRRRRPRERPLLLLPAQGLGEKDL